MVSRTYSRRVGVLTEVSSLSGSARGDIAVLEVENEGAEEYRDDEVDVADDDVDREEEREEEATTVEEFIERGFCMAAWALTIVL